MKLKFIIILFLAAMGCSQDSNESLRETKWIDTLYYGSKSIQAVITYDQDSILNGPLVYFYPNGNVEVKFLFRNGILKDTAKYYYETGELKSTAVYKDSLLNGVSVHYFTDGGLEKEISYYEDLRHGPSIFYNKSGKIEFIENYFAGDQVGHSLWNFQNGKPKQYVLFDFESRLRYLEKYDSLGNLIERGGEVMPQFYQSNDSIYFLYALPPNLILNIKILTESDEKEYFLDNISYLNITESVQLEGTKGYLEIIGNLMNASGSVILSDTIIINDR